jgi:hypothetical protein
MHDIIAYVPFLDINERNGKKYISCTIRKKELVLQPEELVRQAYIVYLIEGLSYSKMKIAVEKGVKVNGLQKRFDIMVYDKHLDPFILVECKSMFVELTQDVLEQVSQYNLSFNVPYMVVTNGKIQHVFKMNNDKTAYEKIDHLPNKEEI